MKSSEDAIRQAGRNLLISFKESVTRELKVILSENIGAAYSSEGFAELISKVVLAWANKSDVDDITVVLNSEDLEKLEKTLLSMLKDKISGGVTLRASASLDSGFRIATGDSGAYYDYSAEAVVDMISGYLSPKVTALLKEAQ